MEYIRSSVINYKDNINQRVFVQFLAKDVEIKSQKDKTKKFITLKMKDRDTEVVAKLFDATSEQIEQIVNSNTYNAAVDIQSYKKSPEGFSCIIYNIERSDIPPENFAEWAEGLVESKVVIEKALGKIINSTYGKIAYSIVLENWEKLSYWSAAKSQHHNLLGGLLTHNAELINLADRISDYYNSVYGEKFINKDLLFASVILHDICKIRELDVDNKSGQCDYSVQASLSTHIMDIIAEVEIQAHKLNIGVEDNNLKTEEQLRDERECVLLLRHCLSAHHGKKEYGSPIEASIPEAYILNKIDEISAEMFRFNRSLRDIKPGESKTEWENGGMRSVYRENNKL